jgi:NodT family efflux transporter outer membrane factor (OMF) lipoprotein
MKILRNFLLITSSLLALAACTVGPDYQKPDSLLPSGWFSAGANKPINPTKEAADEMWWRNFNDPVLNTLIAQTAQNNLDLKIAVARVAQARATRADASADMLPKVNITGSAVRQANQFAFPAGPPGLTAPFNTFQAGFDASWELDVFGGKRRALEGAEADVEAAEAQGADTLVSLLAEVARTYIDIRQYQTQLSLASDVVKAERGTADIAQERYKAGQTAHVDVTRANAELANAQAQIPYYQNMLAQAEYSADVLLGAQPGTAHGLINGTGDIPAANKKLILDAPAAVIANRPDILASERKLASATARQGVAAAQFFPDISLSGFLGLLTTDAGKILDIHSKSWRAGASVLWPILNYGTLTANQELADASKDEALAGYQKTVIAALSDVEKSYTAYIKQQDYQAALEKAVKDNRQAMSVARARYKDGLVAFLEVLDAQRTLYASESRMAEATAKTSQNLVALYKSLGGGWKIAPNALNPRQQQPKT